MYEKSISSANSKIEVLNQLLNFFWTILCFLPVLWYWVMRGPDSWLYGSIIFSIICGLLPEGFFRLLQISQSVRVYEKYGAKIIRKFVQQGDMINRLFRQQYPGRKVIRDASQAKNYLKTIAMYERYHFMCFLFFLSTAMHSLFAHRFLFALLITIGNVLYNICPIFLQQYNRLRVRRLLKK